MPKPPKEKLYIEQEKTLSHAFFLLRRLPENSTFFLNLNFSVGMGSGTAGKKNKMRRRLKKLLHLPDRVEVRSEDEGFEGSWHEGTVTGRRKIGSSAKFEIEFDHFLDVDVVTVSLVVSDDEQLSSTRGCIRPFPPEFTTINEYMLPFGLCVDVNCNNKGWREGVVFDYEGGSNQRTVFFPDVGDEKVVPVGELRITQDWGEVSGKWNRRGMWLFLDLIEEYIGKGGRIPVSIKQLWYDLRHKKGFRNIGGGDWTCSSRPVWEELVSDTVCRNLELVSDRLFCELSLPDGARKLSELAKSVNSETDNADSDSKLQQLLLTEKSTPERDELCVEVVQMASLSGEIVETVSSSSAMEIKSCDLDQANNSSSHGRSDSKLPQPLLIENSIPEGDEVSTSSAMETERCDLLTPSLRKNQKFRWLPAGADMVQEPKYCPEAIVKYAQGSREMVAKAKQHLLYLEWNIQYYMDEHKRPRFHFISPDGKCYYSLKQVCRILVKSEGTKNPPLSDSRYECPKAIVDCYKVSCAGGASKNSDVIKRAKENLKAMGWSIEEKLLGSGRRVKVYKSPGGQSYISLRMACQRCMNETDTSVASKPIRLERKSTSGDIRRSQRGKNHQTGAQPDVVVKIRTPLPKSRSTKTAEIYSRVADMKKLTQPKHLRSSKRVKLTPKKSSGGHPLTMVSWLIDNNTILPRDKVYYRTSKGGDDGDSKPKGRITRKGIKCFCCMKVFSLSSFEIHVGNKYNRNYHHGPSSSLFLADGRSLSDCQVQVMRHGKEMNLKEAKPLNRMKGRRDGENDDVCSVCQYGGDLVLCDECPSSFHGGCLGMQDVPPGDWFCPSCCCRICKRKQVRKDSESFLDESVLKCTQCQYNYHITCLKNNGVGKKYLVDKEGNWFCGKNCTRIFADLSAHLGIPIPAGVNDLTCTLQKSASESDGRTAFGVAPDIEAEAQSYMKLGIALDVIHECFEPLKESSTGRDVVSDVIFSQRSKIRRLDFRGFYTVLLEKDDEVISVATIRIFGDNVAEVPLVATRHQYRQRGMCRILMNVIEKKLTELGVKRLVLPAVPSMLNTWTGSFGFSKVTDSERLQFVDTVFLNFPGTIMCHKLLTTTNESRPLKKEIPSLPNSGNGEEMELELDGSPSLESEKVQAERTEQQGAPLAKEHSPIGSKPEQQQPSTPMEDCSKAETDCRSGSSRLTPRKPSRYGDYGLLKYHRRMKRKICK